MSRDKLEKLLGALNGAKNALRRDECLDWAILGKTGTIWANNLSFLIWVHTGQSKRKWNNLKRTLSFCRVAQDGDDEGCLHLERLPNSSEAALIRGAIGLNQTRQPPPNAFKASDDSL